jgi:hypothetical protein
MWVEKSANAVQQCSVRLALSASPLIYFSSKSTTVRKNGFHDSAWVVFLLFVFEDQVLCLDFLLYWFLLNPYQNIDTGTVYTYIWKVYVVLWVVLFVGLFCALGLFSTLGYCMLSLELFFVSWVILEFELSVGVDCFLVNWFLLCLLTMSHFLMAQFINASLQLLCILIL